MTTIKKKQYEDQFSKIQKSYGLRSPRAIKERILWKHIKMVSLSLFGDTPENKKLMAQHDLHWSIAEREEKKPKRKSTG